jgi:hypothetical protein
MARTKDPRIEALEAGGYTVIKTKSYKAAQRRQDGAEMLAVWAERDAESARKWARDCLTEERRLRDRCQFLASLAIAHGATLEDLRQPEPNADPDV